MQTDKKEPAMTQRTPEEMMNLILSRAENDAHIRVVGMEGSRTNQNIPKDRFQDFDVTYFVDDPALYTKDDTWVNVFGERLIMQKPEDMELFPAVEDGYSFLMFFTDYNKIDLTILPLTALEDYLMSTEQLPHFGGARKSSAEMQAGAKGCTESCGDSAPVSTWQSHGQRFPAVLR